MFTIGKYYKLHNPNHALNTGVISTMYSSFIQELSNSFKVLELDSTGMPNKIFINNNVLTCSEEYPLFKLQKNTRLDVLFTEINNEYFKKRELKNKQKPFVVR